MKSSIQQKNNLTTIILISVHYMCTGPIPESGIYIHKMKKMLRLLMNTPIPRFKMENTTSKLIKNSLVLYLFRFILDSPNISVLK